MLKTSEFLVKLENFIGQKLKKNIYFVSVTSFQSSRNPILLLLIFISFTIFIAVSILNCRFAVLRAELIRTDPKK